MTRRIEYFFSLASPWSFLGHARLMAIAARANAEVAFHPVALGPVFAETGGLPLAKRAPPRQRLRLVELQRWRLKLGLDFHIQPQHWPFDASLADRLVIATLTEGHSVEELLPRLFAGVWQKQENLAEPAVLARLAEAVGLPGTALVARANAADVAAAYASNHALALESDVFGAPSYVLDGEVFWGQDRLDLLDDALTSGRAPFKP